MTLTINNEIVASFPVTRGVRQGCPLSPLFALTIEPFLIQVENHPSVLGLQTPGIGTVKVAAYADDITIYHRDEDSLATVL